LGKNFIFTRKTGKKKASFFAEAKKEALKAKCLIKSLYPAPAPAARHSHSDSFREVVIENRQFRQVFWLTACY